MGFRIYTSATFGALTNALDAAALRQEAISANLANANTPGYRRKEVLFSAELAARQDGGMRRTDARHLDAAGTARPQPILIADPSGPMRRDGNNVDPDAEAARLAETEITYSALTQALSAQFAGLRTAITGTPR